MSKNKCLVGLAVLGVVGCVPGESETTPIQPFHYEYQAEADRLETSVFLGSSRFRERLSWLWLRSNKPGQDSETETETETETEADATPPSGGESSGDGTAGEEVVPPAGNEAPEHDGGEEEVAPPAEDESGEHDSGEKEAVPPAEDNPADQESGAEEAVPDMPARSLQSLVDEAPAGSAVVVPAGIYRETVNITKPLTLIAENGAEIRGSDNWSVASWSHSNGRWTSDLRAPSFSANPNYCYDGDLNCLRREQVFLDGRQLRHVEGSPGVGEFALNSNRNVILGDNPEGKLVEVTTRTRWMTIGADNVVIDGLSMRHAAAEYNHAALINSSARGQSFSGLTIRNCELAYSASHNVKFQHTGGHRLENCDVHHGGQGGVASYRAGVNVSNNRIFENNPYNAFSGWTSAGIKYTNTPSGMQMVIEDNHVYRNNGTGIWGDVYNDGAVIRRNRAHHNARPGIRDEVSSNVLIEYNVVYENGYGIDQGPEQAGIFIQDSNGATVRHNVVAWNNSGIYVYAENRTQSLHDAPAARHNNTVHNNDVFIVATRPFDVYGLIWLDAGWNPPPAGDGLAAPGHNNRGYGNRYFHHNPSNAQPHPFRWLGTTFAWSNLAGFSDTPGESGATVLSAAQRDSVLDASGVPREPERR